MGVSAWDKLLEPVVEGLGFQLYGIEYFGGNTKTLRIYIDHDNGIGIKDCERVSKQISSLLDVEDVVKDKYVLEVSSPGLDRPLLKHQHYVRYVGCELTLKLSSPVNERKRYKGTIEKVEQEDVTINVDGEPVIIPFHFIFKAKLVPEY